MREQAYLSLGSNIGNRIENVRKAISLLEATKGLKVEETSPFYESLPVGLKEQADFINAVIRIRTDLSPLELLHRTREIEKEGGRIRTIKWGPRTIDIDILLFGQHIIELPDLGIPHKEMMNRNFVLAPLLDISRDLVYPLTGVKISEMLAGKNLDEGINRLDLI